MIFSRIDLKSWVFPSLTTSKASKLTSPSHLAVTLWTKNKDFKSFSLKKIKLYFCLFIYLNISCWLIKNEWNLILSQVSRIFKDPSIGNPISLSITKIVKIEEVFGTRQNGTDGIAAAEMLKKFCYWQKHNNPDEPSPEHHDVALLLTRSVAWIKLNTWI